MNMVLVHGAYADGSCWSDVMARLQDRGHTVTSVQNALTSLDDGANGLARRVPRHPGLVGLVGALPSSRSLVDCPGRDGYLRPSTTAGLT